MAPPPVPARITRAALLLAVITIFLHASHAAAQQSDQEATLPAPALTARAANNTIELRWEPVNRAARYDLRSWTESGGWLPLGGDNLTATAFIHTDITPGVDYYYWVRAFDADGNPGEWSPRQSATLPGAHTPTPAPPAQTATATPTPTPDTAAQTLSPDDIAGPALLAEAGDGAVELHWDSVEGAAYYDLRAYTEAGRLGAARRRTPDRRTSYRHAPVTAGIDYYYWVRAVFGSDDFGPWSPRVPATLPPQPFANTHNSPDRHSVGRAFIDRNAVCITDRNTHGNTRIDAFPAGNGCAYANALPGAARPLHRNADRSAGADTCRIDRAGANAGDSVARDLHFDRANVYAYTCADRRFGTVTGVLPARPAGPGCRGQAWRSRPALEQNRRRRLLRPQGLYPRIRLGTARRPAADRYRLSPFRADAGSRLLLLGQPSSPAGGSQGMVRAQKRNRPVPAAAGAVSDPHRHTDTDRNPGRNRHPLCPPPPRPQTPPVPRPGPRRRPPRQQQPLHRPPAPPTASLPGKTSPSRARPPATGSPGTLSPKPSITPSTTACPSPPTPASAEPPSSSAPPTNALPPDCNRQHSCMQTFFVRPPEAPTGITT